MYFLAAVHRYYETKRRKYNDSLPHRIRKVAENKRKAKRKGYQDRVNAIDKRCCIVFCAWVHIVYLNQNSVFVHSTYNSHYIDFVSVSFVLHSVVTILYKVFDVSDSRSMARVAYLYI